jgi:putative OPT family oligopeptide transporter
MAPTPPQKYRELTVAAVLLGIVQGIILNVAFAYTALKLGFSMGASPIAALLGYVFLRGILRKGTIVENNINQTIAAGIASAGTGVVFVLPAIFLLNAQEHGTLAFSFWPLLLASIGGAILGVVLLIPLRKQLIEIERLRFPSGVAVAAIIRAGAEGVAKAKLLGIGFSISAVWTVGMLLGWFDYPGLIANQELNLSFGLLPAYLAPALYLSPMNFAAGLLAGRGGLSFLWGGILAWWIISPASVLAGWTPPLEGQALADFIYGNMLRPLGIGIILGSAFMEVFVNFPAIKSAILSLMAASRSGSVTTGKGSDEAPMSVLLVTGGIAVVCFFLAAWITPGVSFPQALLTALLGSLWLALAGLIVAQTTGLTDISPVSGLALISVSIMMVLLNGNIVAALLFTITVAVAISHSADMMQDLKTGFLVGSRPLLQQIVQIGIGWIGVIFTFGIVYALWDSGTAGQHGFGPGTPLPAPQAATLTSIVEAVKNHSVPIDKFLLGSLVGLLLGAAPVAGLGVLMGLAMYLPLSITLGYGIGCLMEMAITTRKGLTFTENKIVPLAAGLIIGEAIISVVHAIYQIWHS